MKIVDKTESKTTTFDSLQDSVIPCEAELHIIEEGIQEV